MPLLLIFIALFSLQTHAGCLEHVNQLLEDAAGRVYVHDESSFLKFRAEFDEYDKGITLHPTGHPGKDIGHIHYDLSGHEISNIHIKVDVHFRRQGIAKAL